MLPVASHASTSARIRASYLAKVSWLYTLRKLLRRFNPQSRLKGGMMLSPYISDSAARNFVKSFPLIICHQLAADEPPHVVAGDPGWCPSPLPVDGDRRAHPRIHRAKQTDTDVVYEAGVQSGVSHQVPVLNLLVAPLPLQVDQRLLLVSIPTKVTLHLESYRPENLGVLASLCQVSPVQLLRRQPVERILPRLQPSHRPLPRLALERSRRARVVPPHVVARGDGLHVDAVTLVLSGRSRGAADDHTHHAPDSAAPETSHPRHAFIIDTLALPGLAHVDVCSFVHVVVIALPTHITRARSSGGDRLLGEPLIIENEEHRMEHVFMRSPLAMEQIFERSGRVVLLHVFHAARPHGGLRPTEALLLEVDETVRDVAVHKELEMLADGVLDHGIAGVKDRALGRWCGIGAARALPC
mmetsp:Transcript_25113/g.61958  ORF Transcript_25113/g.61958 Transcript_25113/m.61958 type:complete len:413 (+) Transcript_25113:1347-2585(+)